MITGGFPNFFPQHIVINERNATNIPPSKWVFPYHIEIQQLMKDFMIYKEPIKNIRKITRKHVT